MTSDAQTDRQLMGGRTLALLFLLALSVFINYVDRGNLSVAAPLLKGELHLSAYHLGILLGAFFWTYVTVMIVSGWLVDRFDVNWVLAGGFAIWSLATGLTGLVHGFATLMACRLLLGAGESVAFPAYGKILARSIAQGHRGVANAAIVSGMSLGPALGTFFCGDLMATYGWRPVFVVLGFVRPALASAVDLLDAESGCYRGAICLSGVSRGDYSPAGILGCGARASLQ